MLAIAICDDDVKFADWLQKKLKRGFDEKGIKCRIEVYFTAEYLTKALDAEYFDIVCLDIKIGEHSGIDIGNSIRDKKRNQKSQIVYMSSYPDYHSSGKLYDAAPMAFIRKPVKDDDIKNIVSKAISRIILSGQQDNRYFSFSFNRKSTSVLTCDIVCFECDVRLITIHTTDPAKTYKFYSSLNKIEKKLDNPDFIRIHHAYLANITQIEALKSNQVLCRNGQRFPVSETYYKNACLAINQLDERKRQRDKQYV